MNSEIRLSHVAIAAPTLKEVSEKLKKLALIVEAVHEVPSEKVKAAMIPVKVSEHFRLELLEPTQADSPISKFLAKRPSGGIHHLCFEVTDLKKWKTVLEQSDIQILAPGIRKAARGHALFIHPKEMGGVLVELEQLST